MEQNSNETTPDITETASSQPAESQPAEGQAAAPATSPQADEAAPAAEAPKRAPRRATSRKPVSKPADDAPVDDAKPVADAAVAEESKTAARKTRSTKATSDKAAATTAATETVESADAAASEAPKRVSRARKKVVPVDETPQTEASGTAPTASATTEAQATEATAETPAAEEAPKKTTTRRRKVATPEPEESSEAATPVAESEPASETAEETTTAPRKRSRRATSSTAKAASQAEASPETETNAQAEPATEQAADDAGSAETPEQTPKRNTRSRGRSKNAGDNGEKSDKADATEQPRSQRGQRQQATNADSDSNDEHSQDKNTQKHDRDEQQSSRSRTRQRDRKRRGQHNDDLIDPELTEDDVLLPIAGILDVLDNYAFVRTTGYLPGSSDVYVSLGQVKKYNLRKGDAIVGSIRKPSEHDGGGRQKYNAIVKIDSVNGAPLTEDMQRVDFNDLTPLYPQDRLRLETAPEKVTQRVIDLISPIGKGQRGLIVAPPKAGKTIVLQQIANAIAENNPEVHLMVVLVDERPEEVTDMQRTVKGEVVASTFDRPAEDHTTVAELAIERAKRLVELGHDVVVLLDSITRLGRAYNLASPASGRVLTGGVDASALYPPKRFFGAARNIENGGSLTILATALVETGSKADEVIFEEFKGTGNMELRLSRQLADRRIFPAVNLNASSTRREEMLLSPDEVKITWKLRRALGNLSEEQAAELVLNKLRETQSNAEFLLLMQKSQGLS